VRPGDSVTIISDQEILEALASAVRMRGRVSIPASGRSMGPEFSTLRDIVVEPFSPSAIRPGSIVVFQREGRWIVHRVMWKFGKAAGPFCITKGDNVGQLDHPYVQASEIQGLVVGLQTNDGVAINLTSPYRRLASVMRVARGWVSLGLARVLASR